MTEKFEIDQEILAEFIKETIEELDGLDAQFIALEKNPKDAAVLNAIFRTMHSIKGSSAFFNLTHIRNFTHKLENLLDDLRKGGRVADTGVINILLAGKDHVDNMLGRLAGGDLSTGFSSDEETLLNTVESILASEKEEARPYQLFLEIDKLREDIAQDESMENKPVTELFELIEKLREAVLGPESAPAEKAPPIGEMLVKEGLVTHEDVIDALSKQKKIGEILVEEGKIERDALASAIESQRRQTAAIAEARRQKALPSSAIAGLKKTMRIEEEKIDRFINAVGELINNAEVFNHLQKKLAGGRELGTLPLEFKNANVELRELIFNLQKELLEVRKVPLKGIFQKLPRMVRDLASSVGKQVDLTMSGEDLLIDKSLFERLESPLSHLIRNAVDHGIETPDIRERNGKNPVGRITVTAEMTSSGFIMRIKDDGKGILAERVKNMAIEKGIVTPAAADAMPDKEACKLIFAPGFSTAERVTDVSGRGVGMDVVMTTLKENRGKIDIETDPGRGTEFTLTFPVSTPFET